MLLDINLKPVPLAFRIENTLTTHTERQQAVEPSYFFRGITKLRDKLFFLKHGMPALDYQSLFTQDPPHGQRQPAEAIFENVIIRSPGDHLQGGFFRYVARDQNE